MYGAICTLHSTLTTTASRTPLCVMDAHCGWPSHWGVEPGMCTEFPTLHPRTHYTDGKHWTNQAHKTCTPCSQLRQPKPSPEVRRPPSGAIAWREPGMLQHSDGPRDEGDTRRRRRRPKSYRLLAKASATATPNRPVSPTPTPMMPSFIRASSAASFNETACRDSGWA
jgi:hypothetical protein